MQTDRCRQTDADVGKQQFIQKVVSSQDPSENEYLYIFVYDKWKREEKEERTEIKFAESKKKAKWQSLT